MLDDHRKLPRFLRLRLATQAVAIGERVKRGTFRPCVEAIPTSTMMGCLTEHFGLAGVIAIGFFDSRTYQKKLFTYAPFDAALGTAKLPLTLEYLAPAEGHSEIVGEVYVVATEATRKIFAKGVEYTVAMGALRSKGFGLCQLTFKEEVQPGYRIGYLRGHLRESDAPGFGVDPRPIQEGGDIISPRYGYLFRPDGYRIGGKYERALLTDTILRGPDLLIGREYPYDY
ncbi:MAG: hypothetical protein QXS96_07595 [Candidatus Caldarchaeum sp.]